MHLSLSFSWKIVLLRAKSMREKRLSKLCVVYLKRRFSLKQWNIQAKRVEFCFVLIKSHLFLSAILLKVIMNQISPVDNDIIEFRFFFVNKFCSFFTQKHLKYFIRFITFSPYYVAITCNSSESFKMTSLYKEMFTKYSDCSWSLIVLE